MILIGFNNEAIVANDGFWLVNNQTNMAYNGF